MRNVTLMFVVAGLAACRSGGTSGGTGSGGGGGGGGTGPDAPPAAVSIKSIRMNQPTNGAPVSLANVVVTGRVTSKKSGKLWVQDAGGGPYSGIELFCNYGGTKPDCSMTQAQMEAFAIGDVVNATGSFNSFLLSTAPAGAQPNLEIEKVTITATGQKGTATAVDVPAATLAADQLAAAGAEPYKGAYVHVTGGPFKASSISAMEYAATCTDKSMPTPQMGTTFSGFEASAGSTMLDIGLSFYNTVTYCLPCAGVAMPYPCNNALTLNESFTNVSGIVEPEYNANGKVYLQIAPTNDADLAK